WTTAIAGGSGCVRQRQPAGCVREGCRSTAVIAALRRALGALLARLGPLCGWTIRREQGYTVRQRLPLSRLGDPGVERRHALRCVRQGPDRRRSYGWGQPRKTAARSRLSGAWRQR